MSDLSDPAAYVIQTDPIPPEQHMPGCECEDHAPEIRDPIIRRAWRALMLLDDLSLEETQQLADDIAAVFGGRTEVDRGEAIPLEKQLRIEEGPVVIGQSKTDPGDMGEPGVFRSDGVTYVTVPDFDAWWHTCVPRLPDRLSVERLAEAMRRARQAVSWTPEAKDIAAEYLALTTPGRMAPTDGPGD